MLDERFFCGAFRVGKNPLMWRRSREWRWSGSSFDLLLYLLFAVPFRLWVPSFVYHCLLSLTTPTPPHPTPASTHQSVFPSAAKLPQSFMWMHSLSQSISRTLSLLFFPPFFICLSLAHLRSVYPVWFHLHQNEGTHTGTGSPSEHRSLIENVCVLSPVLRISLLWSFFLGGCAPFLGYLFFLVFPAFIFLLLVPLWWVTCELLCSLCSVFITVLGLLMKYTNKCAAQLRCFPVSVFFVPSACELNAKLGENTIEPSHCFAGLVYITAYASKVCAFISYRCLCVLGNARSDQGLLENVKLKKRVKGWNALLSPGVSL